MNIGDNIRYLRIQKDMSQEDLANSLGYKSYTTITKWESGVSEPSLKMVHRLAAYFGVSVNDLCYKQLDTRNVGYIVEHNGISTIIEVLGRVAAGIPIGAVEEVIDTEEITQSMASTGDFFGLKIDGDSMEPKISKGDVVIVRKQEDADSGDIVIAMVNGNDATCKRLRKYRDGIELVSTNPNYAPMFFSNEEIQSKPVKIIGKVVELRAKF